MQARGWWQPHPTLPGAKPDNVILQDKEKNEEAKTPWRQKISCKVNTMLNPAKTTQDWEHPANKDARTFHAFVSGEGGLGLQECHVGGEEAQGRPEASKGNKERYVATYLSPDEPTASWLGLGSSPQFGRMPP